MDRNANRRKLRQFLLETGRVRESDLDANAALITSGLVNSVALFDLALWIEETVGRPIDMTQIALPAAWDTLDAILDFMSTASGGDPPR